MPNEKSSDLRKMQRIATAAVAVAFMVLIGTLFMPDAGWVQYLRAFSEAAVIGGLSDWFAVTALFRHPLGLPIPHTRILPRGKNRIARSLSHFVVSNFLSREVVERELAKMDLSATGAEWIEAKSEDLASWATKYLPSVLLALDDEDITRFLETQFTDRLRNIPIAPVAGKLIELLTSGDKHERIVDDLLALGGESMDENRDMLINLIRKEIPMPDSFAIPGIPIALPIGSMKDKLAGLIAEEGVKRILRTIAEVRGNPSHEIRTRIQERISRLAADLKESPEMQTRGEEIKLEFLANSNVASYASHIWAEIKTVIEEDTASADSQIRKQIANGLRRAAAQIRADEAIREKFNTGIRVTALHIICDNTPQVSRIIEETVARWDGAELAYKLELEVGRDLQFVRLNGTLVGGLLGVVLHFVTSLI